MKDNKKCYDCRKEMKKDDKNIFCKECVDKPRDSSKSCMVNIYASV